MVALMGLVCPLKYLYDMTVTKSLVVPNPPFIRRSSTRLRFFCSKVLFSDSPVQTGVRWVELNGQPWHPAEPIDYPRCSPRNAVSSHQLTMLQGGRERAENLVVWYGSMTCWPTPETELIPFPLLPRFLSRNKLRRQKLSILSILSWTRLPTRGSPSSFFPLPKQFTDMSSVKRLLWGGSHRSPVHDDEEIVLLVLGLTGTGKSFLIQSLMGEEAGPEISADGFDSCMHAHFPFSVLSLPQG